MLADRLRNWAGVGLLAVLGVAPLRAQDPFVSPGRAPLTALGSADQKLPPALPEAPPVAASVEPPETFHTEYHPAPAEVPERSLASGLFFDADYLLIKPRRNALDFAVVAPNRQEIPSGSIESLQWELRSA